MKLVIAIVRPDKIKDVKDALLEVKVGKVTVSIPHVTWREGRPRFIPGRHLRAEGFKGRDLRHDDGRWFTIDEAAAWSEQFG